MDVKHLHDLMYSEIRRLESLISTETSLRLARREDDKEALNKAEVSVNRRLEDMNQLRRQIEAERSSYASRDMLDRVIGGISDRISAIEKWQFKIIGALVLLTFVTPTITGLAVYILTRHGVEVQTK